MNIFFSDLDNTIIYSHCHSMDCAKRVAEYLNGREQSYITEYTYESLKAFCRKKDNLFVPVTTRSIVQYSRLRSLWKEIGCTLALVCNGAVLLDRDEIDRKWEAESLEQGEPYRKMLEEIYQYLKDGYGTEHLHYAEPYMVYIKMPASEQVKQYLISGYKGYGIETIYSSGKLYCVPEVFSKGNAVKRFLKRVAVSVEEIHTIAAGDSEFDVSMLKQCSSCFFPDDDGEKTDAIFSDMIFRNLNEQNDWVCNNREESNL